MGTRISEINDLKIENKGCQMVCKIQVTTLWVYTRIIFLLLFSPHRLFCTVNNMEWNNYVTLFTLLGSDSIGS